MLMILLRLLFILLCPSWGVAAISSPLREASEIPKDGKVGWDRMKMMRVSTSQVVMADYALIAQDFAAQRRQRGESVDAWKNRIDQWLVSETGFIRAEQTAANNVNSNIPTSDEIKISWQPPAYNRAAVIPVQGGFIDVKGSGANQPKQRHHGNGLATLGEGIREFMFEKLVDRVLRHSKSGVQTVGCYAVLDYGFDVIHADQKRDRAGLILRQAHRRAVGHNSMIDLNKAIFIEETLRRYGLTSSGETMKGHVDFDYINIQGTHRTDVTEIIDFGAFMAVEKFTRKTVNPHKTQSVIWAENASIQPHPDLRVPLEQWGDFGTSDPKDDKPWRWSHELAKSWAEGRADRRAFNTHFNNLMAPFNRRLLALPLCGQAIL